MFSHINGKLSPRPFVIWGLPFSYCSLKSKPDISKYVSKDQAKEPLVCTRLYLSAALRDATKIEEIKLSE